MKLASAEAANMSTPDLYKLRYDKYAYQLFSKDLDNVEILVVDPGQHEMKQHLIADKSTLHRVVKSLNKHNRAF
jgi:hypothetical protein